LRTRFAAARRGSRAGAARRRPVSSPVHQLRLPPVAAARCSPSPPVTAARRARPRAARRGLRPRAVRAPQSRSPVRARASAQLGTGRLLSPVRPSSGLREVCGCVLLSLCPSALFCWCSGCSVLQLDPGRPHFMLAIFCRCCYLFVVAAAIYYIKLFSFVSCSISINPSPHIFLQFIEAVRVHNSVSQPISS